jgi:glycerol-3-phosphate dehydrogenase
MREERPAYIMLSVKRRYEARKAIAGGQFDLCVVGGGAQLRGLRTVMVDAGDFASAASSASTKLIHGGVRYLEQAVKQLNFEEYRMVERALEERVYMLSNAPHLAHASEFLVPVYSWPQAAYYRVGMAVYDLLAGKHNLFPSRFLSRDETLARMPNLKPVRLRGAITYSDGQFDDARYDLSLVKSFTEAGGEALNYARVKSFERSDAGALVSAIVGDELSGDVLTISARSFVNATGPASDKIRGLASPQIKPRLRPSKGVHVLFPLDVAPGRDALLVPRTEDGRVIFAVPWNDRLLVGTTDDEVTPETRMVVLRSEAEYLLRQLNPYLSRPLRVEEVVSGLSGLRPLVAARGKRDDAGTTETSRLIRDHEVELDAKSGLISILGGKWTTHRLMAQDTIDAVQKSSGNGVTPCRTKSHLLAGAEGYTKDYARSLEREFSLPSETAAHLAHKFGTRANGVLLLCRENAAWRAPLVDGFPAIQAEAVYCMREELAVTIEDVLARRIGLQQYDWRMAMSAAPLTATLLGRELSWTAAETESAVSGYTGKLAAYRAELGLGGT